MEETEKEKKQRKGGRGLRCKMYPKLEALSFFAPAAGRDSSFCTFWLSLHHSTTLDREREGKRERERGREKERERGERERDCKLY